MQWNLTEREEVTLISLTDFCVRLNFPLDTHSIFSSELGNRSHIIRKQQKIALCPHYTQVFLSWEGSGEELVLFVFLFELEWQT